MDLNVHNVNGMKLNEHVNGIWICTLGKYRFNFELDKKRPQNLVLIHLHPMDLNVHNVNGMKLNEHVNGIWICTLGKYRFNFEIDKKDHKIWYQSPFK
jgi:uncharacterized cupin superfamily protein